MEILGLINSIIATVGITNIVILLGAAVGVIWGLLGAVAFFIKKSDLKKLGPATFDTTDDKPKPKKRRILKRKV